MSWKWHTISGREAVRNRPTVLGVVGRAVQLEVALTRARDLDHQRERLLQKRLELGLTSQLEKSLVEVALVADLLEFGAGSVGAHAWPPDLFPDRS